MKLLMTAVLVLASQAAMASPPPPACSEMAKQSAKALVDVIVAPGFAAEEKASKPVVRSVKSSILEGVPRWAITVGMPITTEDRPGNKSGWDIDTMLVTLAQNSSNDCERFMNLFCQETVGRARMRSTSASISASLMASGISSKIVFSI